MHVDEFIDRPLAAPDLSYARFWFLLDRLPAHMQMAFRPWVQQFKLFCTYEDVRYRVTGASRMGDVWLHSKLDWDDTKDKFYEKRVNLSECHLWSDTP